ncbi:MAG: sulfite exporter TauE/SafE family protein [Chitinophagaceae bacterium]
MLPLYIFILIASVAFLYAAVGHGGASAYIAILSIIGVHSQIIKPTALILNAIVSLIAFLFFTHKKHFNLKLFLYLAIASIPFAIYGASLHIEENGYKKILGLLLLLTAFRFLIPLNKDENIKPYHIPIILFIGASIGFVSGLIGIGGGILLTPLLLLLQWEKTKTVAGVSALFIFVNSISGLISHFYFKTIVWHPQHNMLIIVALFGALLGSYFGSFTWNSLQLKRILSIVLIIASIKLVLT